jgi:nucleotide-binding universal stress UspA family protein
MLNAAPLRARKQRCSAWPAYHARPDSRKYVFATHDEDTKMYFHALSANHFDEKARALSAVRRFVEADRLPARILVAFNGTPAARCALEYAMERARDEGAAIHVVTVQPAISDKDAGERILDAARVQLELNDIRHTSELAFGAVAESIVRSAAMEDCALIVVGKRERLAIASFFSASVSDQVVRLARVPVTVVKQTVTATTHSPTRSSTSAWRPAW